MDDFDDGPSPFAMMGLLGMAPMVAMMMVGMVAWTAILYIIARWRNHRLAEPDPQLGLKFALHLFRLHGFQLLLLGGFFLVYSILHKGGGRGDIVRPGFGFLVVGGLVFGVHSLVLTKTNQDSFPVVGRLFAGLNLIISGVVGFVALIVAFQMLFQKGEGGDAARAVWSLVLTYVTAWGVQGAMFGNAVLGSGSPDDVARGPGMPSAPPPSSIPEPMQRPLG